MKKNCSILNMQIRIMFRAFNLWKKSGVRLKEKPLSTHNSQLKILFALKKIKIFYYLNMRNFYVYALWFVLWYQS